MIEHPRWLRVAAALTCMAFGATGAAEAELTSDVRIVGGKPALFINGEQKSLIFAAPYRAGARDFNSFREGGIENFNFSVRFPWRAPDTKPAGSRQHARHRLWTWDCFEAYVDNIDDPPHRYRELQMSPRGEWLDLDIDATRERIGTNDERGARAGPFRGRLTCGEHASMLPTWRRWSKSAMCRTRCTARSRVGPPRQDRPCRTTSWPNSNVWLHDPRAARCSPGFTAGGAWR